jgi:hypothetical protein
MSQNLTQRKWLQQKPHCAIFDFDSTLFNSPDKETGELLYLEGTGELWPHAGWWGRIESLLPPVVPDPVPIDLFIEETILGYKEAVKNKAQLVLMTGRPFRTRRRVEEILKSRDLVFDNYFYRGMKGQTGRNTLEIKTNIILNELIHPSLEVLEIWEDRPEHTSEFMTLAKKLKSKYSNHLTKVIVHDVPTKLHYEF